MAIACEADQAKKTPAQKARAQQGLKPFGPQQIAEHRPASTNPSGSDLHQGDKYAVDHPDGQGPPPPINTHDADNGESQGVKAGDLQKCVDHAAAIKGIVEHPNFSDAAKRAAIRDANAAHAPDCAGLCNQTGENAAKAAPVAYNPASKTKHVGWFISTNLPGWK